MARLSLFVVGSFLLGFLVASTLSGCSRTADRTLTIYQHQSTNTYAGEFRLDTSGLPNDAIQSIVDTGGPGAPSKHVTLSKDYQVEVVVRLASPH